MADIRRISVYLIGLGILPIIWAGSAAAATGATEGKALFNDNCAACHQKEGIGKPGTAPSLTDKEFLAAASDNFILTTIRGGRKGTAMVPWNGNLKDNEIKSIVSYLRTFSPSKGGVINRADNYQAMGDERLGRDRFNAICAGCHGLKGVGMEAGGSGTAIGKSGFLNVASDGYIRTIIKHGRSNTPMHGFQGPEGLANLTNKEIDDIIRYLRSL